MHSKIAEALAALLADGAETHNVIAFPFAAAAPEQEADRFAQDLSRAVAEAKAAGALPIPWAVSSARPTIARHPEVWQEMTTVPGARFVMLGTPNSGSYSINEQIGRAGTLKKLALLDKAAAKVNHLPAAE